MRKFWESGGLCDSNDEIERKNPWPAAWDLAVGIAAIIDILIIIGPFIRLFFHLRVKKMPISLRLPEEIKNINKFIFFLEILCIDAMKFAVETGNELWKHSRFFFQKALWTRLMKSFLHWFESFEKIIHSNENRILVKKSRKKPETCERRCFSWPYLSSVSPADPQNTIRIDLLRWHD